MKRAGADFRARIETPITLEIATLADHQWLPHLAQNAAPDADWRWVDLIREHPDEDDYASFAVVSEDRVDGLLIVARNRSMRAPMNAFAMGCYMEYLASAPWNRVNTAGQPLIPDVERMTPVGRVLLMRAAMLSLSLGHDGRLAWNSLDSAIDWYRQMVPDALVFPPGPGDDGYHYFEMGMEHSRQLLALAGSLFT